MNAALVGVGLLMLAASPVHAVTVTADIDTSQIGVPDPARMTIPLPDFSFAGGDDTIDILFTDAEFLRVTLPGTGAITLFAIQLTGDSDGGGDNVGHQSGSVSLLDGNGDPIPLPLTTDLLFSDVPLFVSGTILNLSPGDSFLFHGIRLVGSQAFDPANITNAVLRIVNRSSDTPRALSFYPGEFEIVVVSEPGLAMLVLLGLGMLGVAARRGAA